MAHVHGAELLPGEKMSRAAKKQLEKMKKKEDKAAMREVSG